MRGYAASQLCMLFCLGPHNIARISIITASAEHQASVSSDQPIITHHCGTFHQRLNSADSSSTPCACSEPGSLSHRVSSLIFGMAWTEACLRLGPEIKRRTGESESNLRKAFSAAEEAAVEGRTVVIYLDECDTICPPRDPTRPHESRVTSQLLGLLDSLAETRGNAISDCIASMKWQHVQCCARLCIEMPLRSAWSADAELDMISSNDPHGDMDLGY